VVLVFWILILLCEDHVVTCSLINIDGGAFPSFEACMYACLGKNKTCILMLQFVLIMVGSSIDVLCTSASLDLLDFCWGGDS
jgi:hypothetical protein